MEDSGKATLACAQSEPSFSSDPHNNSEHFRAGYSKAVDDMRRKINPVRTGLISLLYSIEGIAEILR